MTVHRIALLVAPFKDRTGQDVIDLYDAKRNLLQRGWLPIFLPDTLAEVLDDEKPDERVRALEASSFFCAVLAASPDCEMIVVGEEMTEGMREDVTAWLNAGGPAPVNIEQLDELVEEEADGGDD